MNVYSNANLPNGENLNKYSTAVNINGKVYIQKGKMIAYYGNLRFEAPSVWDKFNAPAYANNFICVTGTGKIVLADYGKDMSYFNMEGNITLRKESVAMFDDTLTLQESILPGFLSLRGAGGFVVSSNGESVEMKPPLRVDPGALLGWADMPTPAYYYNTTLKSLFGFMSGEEVQIDFDGEGTILIQSSEIPLITTTQV